MIWNLGTELASSCRRWPAWMIGLWLLWVWQHVAGTCWADWPQWRHDANRSGATLQRCSEPLALRWMIDLGVPDPAYDHQYRMCADAATAPVAADGLIFVPSNTSDSVTAYELATGRFRWRYVTEGPVRFAPILIGQQVIFGSDDGYLHCVGSHDGRLRWRIRGAAEHVPDSRMLVNGRLASRWPVRGGPVEASGVVFFGAGIWPEEGVYVTAVTADSGTVLWRSDRMSYVREGMSDHGQAYDLGLPPHGYLAVIDGRLAVPSGRALAAWFDPNSGAMEPYTCFYVKLAPPRGTWFLSGIGQYSVQGGNWFGTRSDSLPPVPPALQTARSGLVGSRSEPEHEVQAARNRPFFDAVKYRLHNENLYPEPVLTETAIYASEFDTTSQYLVPRGHTHITYPAFDKIVARDLTRPVWKLVQEEITAYPAGTKIRRLEFPVLWELRTPLRVLIKAADRLYAGGDDTIAAISIPDDEEMPAIVWQAAVNGHPVNALVSAGCLIVSTNTGKVYCFGDAASVEADGKANIREGASETTTDKHAEPEMSPERPASVPLPRVPPHGYALCLAADAGRGLALANDYRVVLFEPDSERAMNLRQELARDGVPANRVQVVGWNSDLRVTPYWADQVSIRSLVPFGDAASSALDMALDAMRPCTGQGTLPDNEEHRQWLQSSLASREGYQWRSDSGECILERPAPPVGAAEWTHEAAGPGNTYSSPDRLVRWPLAALWYSGDIDRDFTPASHFQHERNPYPLVAHGRMFLIAHQMLHAVDIYTGRYLWRAEMPVTDWVAARSQDSRVYGRPVDRNYLATQDAVYVILEREIHVYSADDGSHRRVIGIPSDVQSEVADPRWTEVREQDGLLHAVVGNRLIVLDRHTGELCWQRPSTLGATTFALGDGRVFGLDFVATGPRGSRNQNPQQGTLFVLNARTGETIWSRSVQYDPVPEHEVDNPRPWLLPIDPQLAYNARHRLIVLVARRNSIRVHRAEDGSPVWHRAGEKRNLPRIYPPVVTDDHLVIFQYNGFFAYVLDLVTGDASGQQGIPAPRTCARVLGSNDLLAYRDAATELYDLREQRMIGLNSVRSGCTTSFIPAGGILTAPMLGHGCVCNYPMFASQALFYWPEIETHRPATVTGSWVNQAESVAGETETRTTHGNHESPLAELPIDVSKLRTINSTVERVGDALRVTVQDEGVGYAVQRFEPAQQTAVFQFAVRRTPDTARNGNVSFIFGDGDTPQRWVECRVFYGGRSSLMIAGAMAEPAEAKAVFKRRDQLLVTVSVDCQARTVTLNAGGQEVTSKLTAALEKITHIGYGGANSDNLLSATRGR